MKPRFFPKQDNNNKKTTTQTNAQTNAQTKSCKKKLNRSGQFSSRSAQVLTDVKDALAEIGYSSGKVIKLNK